MSSPTIWYGWIPNLSGNIFLCDCFNSLSNLGFSQDANKYFIKTIPLSKDPGHYFQLSIKSPDNYSKTSNNNNFELKFDQINITAICKLDKKGLARLEIFCEEEDGSINIGVARTIYTQLRNIFHEHTHHGDEHNLLVLDVVKADSDVHATDQIIKYFLNKIVDYHHFLKTYLSKSYFRKYLSQFLKNLFRLNLDGLKQPSSIEYVTAAEGEMLYAKNFIMLYKDKLDIDQFDEFNIIFENAHKSFIGIGFKIGQILQDYSNKLMVGLTIILVILTIVMISLY